MTCLVLFRPFEVDIDLRPTTSCSAALLIVTVVFWRDPISFAAIIAMVLLAHHYVVEVQHHCDVRSFFGVLKIDESGKDDSARSRTAPHCTADSGSATSRASPSPGVRSRLCIITTAPQSLRAWTPPVRSRVVVPSTTQ